MLTIDVLTIDPGDASVVTSREELAENGSGEVGSLYKFLELPCKLVHLVPRL